MNERATCRRVRDELAAAGLQAGVVARDLDTGSEVGFDGERLYPLASLAKLPIAVAVLHLAGQPDSGVDLTRPVRCDPADRSPGLHGLSSFNHPATVAVEDLLSLSITISDNTATDLLLADVPPAVVSKIIRDRGHREIYIRHSMRELDDAVTRQLGHDQRRLALALAARAATPGGGNLIPQLDVSQANAGTARAMVRLLDDVWHETAAWSDRLRQLLGSAVHRQRLAPDLESDAARWYSKTGTMITLRHEAGVVEHEDGQRIAVAVLSDSTVPARIQPAAEAALGSAARQVHDLLRHG